MSTNSPNSNRRDAPHDVGASKSSDQTKALRSPDGVQNEYGSVEEAQAVQTFEFEVGAGRPTLTEGADSPAATTPVVIPTPAVMPAAASSAAALPHTRKAVSQSTDAASPVDRVVVKATTPARDAGPVVPETAAVPQVVATDEAEAPATLADRAPRRASRQSSWWMTSLGVHVLVLVALGFTTLAVMEEEEIELYASPVVYETVEEFQDLEIDPSEDLESLEDELDAELNDLEADSFADLTSEPLTEEPAAIADATSADVASDLSDLGQLFGEPAAGGGGSELPGGKAMAKFFGTEINARRILYMLDNSGGMNSRGKFEALVTELKRSVSALDPKQKFYVIFYSDTVYPLNYPQSVRKFMAPTERNLKQLDRWLDTVELCYGNAIDEAIAAAEVIRPDAVFLLTDGDLFTTKKKEAILLNRAGRRYPIYTFGLGVGEKTKTADRLRLVAEANEGTFKAVKVSAEMRELAKQKERVYNRDQPGTVWGLKVKPK